MDAVIGTAGGRNWTGVPLAVIATLETMAPSEVQDCTCCLSD